MDTNIDTEVLNQDDEFTSEEAQDDSNESDTSSQFTPRERQLYARLQREKERNKELEELVAQPTETKQVKSTPAFEERLELIAKGYQDEEIAFIQKNGGMRALKDPMVLAALQARKDKVEAESKAVNNVSSKSGVSTRYTESQIAKMSATEYAEKILRQ